jgi:hypothetical protein
MFRPLFGLLGAAIGAFVDGRLNETLYRGGASRGSCDDYLVALAQPDLRRIFQSTILNLEDGPMESSPKSDAERVRVS